MKTLFKSRHNRKEIIERVLDDLLNYKSNSLVQNRYAIQANIDFFQAIKFLPSYIVWLIREAPRLEKENLLELTDLPFHHWDREMHVGLIKMERKKSLGLVKPIVDKITRFIFSENRPLALVNLGCGGMEIERQIIKILFNKSHHQKTLFIGIDKSEASHKLARENLKEFESLIDIRDIENLEGSILEEILKTEKKQYTIIKCKNNIFKLDRDFNPSSFDMVFHSLFRHHLNNPQKKQIDSVIKTIAKSSLEYDGYKSWFIMIPQTIMVWRQPILLNATIFSDLRYSTKEEIRSRIKNRQKLSFFRIGTYLLESNE